MLLRIVTNERKVKNLVSYWPPHGPDGHWQNRNCGKRQVVSTLHPEQYISSFGFWLMSDSNLILNVPLLSFIRSFLNIVSFMISLDSSIFIYYWFSRQEITSSMTLPLGLIFKHYSLRKNNILYSSYIIHQVLYKSCFQILYISIFEKSSSTKPGIDVKDVFQ